MAIDNDIEGKYLTFWTDKQIFGISCIDVVQIIGIQEITEIPEFPIYVKGIISLRGNIIPVVDIRLYLGKKEKFYDDHTCIIVIKIDDHLLGMIVDSINEVTDIPDEDILQPPQVSHDLDSVYLTGITKHDNKVILLLNTQEILSIDQLEAITQSI